MSRPRSLPTTANDVQISIRIPSAWLDEAAELARTHAAGFVVSRSDVLRAAMARGLEAMRAEAGGAKGARRRSTK